MRQYVADATGNLSNIDYRLLSEIAHIFKMADGKSFKSVFGCEVAVEGGWQWTFEPYIQVSSDTFNTKQEATQELSCIQKELYHAWPEKDKREAHLKSIVQRRAQLKALQSVAEERSLKFARKSLQQHCRGCSSTPDVARGFPNLNNTCYINSVLQCLLHCTPFRHDLEGQQSGSNFLGDCLKDLIKSRKRRGASA